MSTLAYTAEYRDEHIRNVELLQRKIESLSNSDDPISEKFDLYNYGLSYVAQLDSIHPARVIFYRYYIDFLMAVGHFDEALLYGIKVINIVENENYDGQYYYLYDKVSKIYFRLGQYQRAVRFEKMGLDLCIKHAGEPNSKADYQFLYNEMGLTYFAVGEYDSAILMYDAALNSGFPFTPHFLFVLEENKAEALIKKGDRTLARNTLNALKIHPGRYSKDRRNINYYLLEAEYALMLKQVKVAGYYLDTAYIKISQSAEQKSEPFIRRRYLRGRHQYLILKGEPLELAQFEIELNYFEDSLSLLSNRNIVKSRNSHFIQKLENEKLKRNNAELEFEKKAALLQQQELSGKYKTVLVIALALAIILLLFIFVRLYKQVKLKNEEKINYERELKQKVSVELQQSIHEQNKLEEVVKFRERDIQTLSNYLTGSSEQIIKLKELLKRINRIADQDEKENILLNYLVEAKQKIHHLEGNTVLLKNIEVINNEFIDRLRQKHPDLTKGDISYCSMIKAGLSNKEIAHEKNTSVNTVKTAKHRLKKKLGLSLERNIEQYISHL